MDPELGDALSRARGVLFLCSGNMVRSAFAELLARHLGALLPVASAATSFRNPAIHPRAAAALAARGVARDAIRAFRPRLLIDLRPTPGPDWVALGMTAAHVAAARGPRAPRAFLLAAAAGRPVEIDDPYPDGDFEAAFDAVEAGVRAVLRRLRGA